jgi:hypothetical protein
MSIQAILLPLFVEVALTLCLGTWLAIARTSAMRRREVHARDIALGEPNWPSKITQISNAFGNQFELPVLFYVLTILSLITHHADLLFVVLAWIFVLSRLAHAIVHTTSNRIQLRGPLFGIGALVLTVAWLSFAVRILAGLP